MDTLTEILRAANKHPNSRVSKLIHTVEEDPSQKNIVLLLIELAEHAEYCTDFNISLKYYMDFFERLGFNHDLVLNEAGLLLVNSSKIYSKRVDYVHSLVERHILLLSNADDELQKQKVDKQQSENAPPEKSKKIRKRALEAPSDPYEVELAPKKFKKLAEEKRFAVPKTIAKAKPISRTIEMEQHIHPACWQHATIYDLENEEDVDTKRNYKLFTYHVEHRYNTLVPDINFRLHFKVKDYMDEQEEMEEDEACNIDRSWPPLSEAYVQKYLRLENYVLQQDTKTNKKKATKQGQGRQDLKEKQLVVNIAPADESQTNLDLEQSSLDSSIVNKSLNLESSLANKSREDSENANINGNNDSGLGESILTNSTLENTQLNCTLETSRTAENLNNSTIPDTRKSFNATESEAGNDSALATSVLDHSGSIYNNTTENMENLTANEEKLINSTLLETTKSLNDTESQPENDSAVVSSMLGESSNIDKTTIEISLDPEATKENSSEVSAKTIEILDKSIKPAGDSKQSQAEDKIKSSENSKDSSLSNSRRQSLSAENVAMFGEDLNIFKENGEGLKIDVVQEQDKNTTQICVHLPHTDDEGVYLSDVDEHDCRLLSPVIKVTNILPGVERKDVTIFMDDDLRQALEMRDGIMEHFGHETYKVPIITQAKPPNLIFNILKLPEKLLRKKVLFKLGPDMDLYLQARTFKHSRPEPVARASRNKQLLQWFSLNNTDMAGVCMTPSDCSKKSSDFCGFSDDDDTISCDEFCGFTEEEQSTLMMKHINRLSRDSGVGVDVNNLTPEKDIFEIIFEEEKSSDGENGKRNSNSDGSLSTENILRHLPAEIRNLLITELEESNEINSTTASVNAETITESRSELTEAPIRTETESENCFAEKLQHCGESIEPPMSSIDSVEILNGKEENLENTSPPESYFAKDSLDCSESAEPHLSSMDKLCTESSTENSGSLTAENCCLNNTPESDVVNASDTCRARNSDFLPIAGSQDKPNDLEMCSDKAQPNKNDAGQSNHFEDANDDDEMNDSDHNLILDLNFQGNKTKIQRWHEYLQPILAKSRDRHHFDVYKLGSEIINTIQSRRKTVVEPLNELKSISALSSNPVVSFRDIMVDKDKSCVSRYFLSTLLLANQSNVEISIHNTSSEEPSSWHDINLKLLSTKRHTVAIEDNIGMIDTIQKAKQKNVIQHSKDTKSQIQNSHQEEVEQKTSELKISLKRNSLNTITSCIVEKRPKENTSPTSTTNSRHKELKNLITSVQIITPPSTMYAPVLPSTSRQAQKINNDLFDFNINAIRTLQPIKKVQKRSDDHDSGIFSIDEISIS